MTKENAKDFLPLIQALAEGRTIQQQLNVGWVDLHGVVFRENPECYRVKPEPREWWILRTMFTEVPYHDQTAAVRAFDETRKLRPELDAELVHVREVI